MADAIEKAQRYLNNMYGHREEWEELEVNGKTGSLLCQGIIRAFQIENGITPITGTVGNKTLDKMRNLAEISIMDPNDDSNPNVCILQCALFAKGYNAGGITGVYYTTGVNAVKEFQSDANIEVTGVIDWKVWMGLVSINWFTKASGGDDNIRTIQRLLNDEWSDIIGVGPCDGVVSRTTAYSMIAALQAAEGINTEFVGMLDGTNFGEETTARFPSVLKQGQNGDYIKYNKLVQYGLYTNGYNAGRFDGIFDATTAEKVAEFQEFYALMGIGLVTSGEVNCSTMKSLLTSKGDTARKAKACDCSTVLNKQQALDIKSAGYQVVGRYLTGTVGGSRRKFITFEELENIENAGLKLFPIYQDGGYELVYFQDLGQGSVDAHTAISAAERLGIPEGTTIYFAVDFDCYEYEMKSFVVPYFKKIRLAFNSGINTKNYKVGIYAPRYICTYISNLGLADYSFVADMSSGYSCNLGYPIPKNWAFDQFYELGSANGCQFESSPSFDLDKVAYSGRDKGISEFDTVPYLTPDQLAEKNADILYDVLRDQFMYNVFEPLGYLDMVTNAGITLEKDFSLTTVETPICTIEVSAKVSDKVTPASEFEGSPITIELDSDGKLTANCENEINNLLVGIDIDVEETMGYISSTVDNLKSVAVSITAGKIGFKVEVDDGFPKLTFIITSDDIYPDSETVNQEITVEISYKLIPKTTSEGKYEVDWQKVASVGVVIVMIGCIAAGAYTALPYALQALGALGLA